MFITFEGGDGTGKTTQCQKLRDYFISQGSEVILTREPGGTELAEKIRSLLLANSGIEDPMTEYLLITAARLDHVTKLIKPALDSGKIVICDRFYDSSLVYQGVLKGLSFAEMDEIYRRIFADFEPSITILLDLDVEKASDRTEKRAEIGNHYDDITANKRQKIREGFLEIQSRNTDRIRVVDALGDQNTVFSRILEALARKMA